MPLRCRPESSQAGRGHMDRKPTPTGKMIVDFLNGFVRRIAETTAWLNVVLIAVILTQVICSKDDAALAVPSKPVGPFYSEHESAKLRAAGFVEVALQSGGAER